MAVPTKLTNAHLLAVGNTEYDVRKAAYWAYDVNGTGQAIDAGVPAAGGATVKVWFGTVADTKPVTFLASDWNTAKAASLAATGG